ncbi:hypothetical protein NBRC116493_35990 [Aurantivibrio infirmus]
MKILPYLKWIIGIAGLFTAIYTSRLISEVYVERDLAAYVQEHGMEPDRNQVEELRQASIKEAAFYIFIFMFGVMASCAWLAFPKQSNINKRRVNT